METCSAVAWAYIIMPAEPGKKTPVLQVSPQDSLPLGMLIKWSSAEGTRSAQAGQRLQHVWLIGLACICKAFCPCISQDLQLGQRCSKVQACRSASTYIQGHCYHCQREGSRSGMEQQWRQRMGEHHGFDLRIDCFAALTTQGHSIEWGTYPPQSIVSKPS